MELGDVLDAPRLRLVPLTGDAGRTRPIGRVHVTDLPDPGRYLAAGDLVLTGLMWHGGPRDSECFVAALAAADVTALGAGAARHGGVPPDLVQACRRRGVPLFEVPVEVAFGDIVEAVDRWRWGRHARGLVAAVGRQRGLVSAMAAGARLADLLPALATELGVRCWILSTTARVVAGSEPLPASTAAGLARQFLAADRLPRQASADGRRFWLAAVAGQPEHRLAGWVLAVACARADAGAAVAVGAAGAVGAAVAGAGAAEPAGLAELAGVAALERAHLDHATAVERRAAEQLRDALLAPADAAELRAALTASRLPPGATFLVLVATLTGLGAPPSLAPAVVAELVRTATDPAPAAVAALPPAGGEVLAVLAVAADRAARAAERLRAAATALTPGLGPGRLAVGISAPAAGAAALPGALLAARHAHRGATGGGAPVSVLGADELASHGLLLAGVPAQTRREFRRRLLGPLLEYDRSHASDLLATLDAFLDCDGSWSRCADRLHLHVNTLRYRIGRIEHLTGRDLSRFADRVDLFLALRLPDA